MSLLNEPIHNASAPVISSRFGFPVREDVALTNKDGISKPGIEKDFTKLSQKLAVPLQRVLEAGETVFWASKALPPLGTIEQLTMGWLMIRYYNCALVFTDRRLLIVGLDASSNWRGTVKSIRWSQMSSIKVGGLFSKSLTFKIASKKYIYTRLGMANASKIKTLLAAWTATHLQIAGQDPMAPGIESLCPRCAKPLTPDVYTCQNCGLVFKDVRTLAIRSLIPGGAYFYIGMTAIGVMHAIFESLFLISIVLVFAGTIGQHGQDASDAIGGAIVELIIVAFAKVVAFYHARRFIREFEPANLAELTSAGSMTATAR